MKSYSSLIISEQNTTSYMHYIRAVRMNHKKAIFWTNLTFFSFVGVRQLWADIHSFGFWCKWVCFQTQSGRGKEYSITNGLIKCPLQSGVSGLVQIQILKLHLSLPPPPILWMLPKTFVSTLIFWGEMISFSHSLCPLFVSRAVK